MSWSALAELFTQSTFDSNVYQMLFSAYELGGYQVDSSSVSGGLYWTYPLMLDNKYINDVCANKPYYDFLCDSWYTNMINKISGKRFIKRILTGHYFHSKQKRLCVFKTKFRKWKIELHRLLNNYGYSREEVNMC